MGGIIAALLGGLFFGTSLVSPTAKAFDHNDFERLVAQGMHPQALRVALKAYDWAAAKGKVKKHIMTVIDFTQPSSKKRLWVINMNNAKILYHGLVAQGKGSGTLYAKHFSDVSGSKASVLGAMVTGKSYHGHHGLSVRIHGLEGINNKVFSRAIVFHSASYATPSFVKEIGRLGRSWGCFAINPAHSNYVFNKIKGGSFVFAYANQEDNDPNFIS